MIRKLPFAPISCYHDFRYYSVFYGEPFLFDEFIYYFDGKDLRVTGYDAHGHAIQADTLSAIIRATEKHGRVRTVTAECPEVVSLARSGISLKRQILGYPSRKYDFEMILNHRLTTSRSLGKCLRKAEKRGLKAATQMIPVLKHQHYLLVDRFVRRFEPCLFFGAEFLASIFHLLSRQGTLFVNCYSCDQIVGFALATSIGELGIIHMTVSAGGHNRVSDVLYNHAIEKLQERGVKRISLGFSLNKGLFNFKRKWGAEPYWRGSYEVLWYRDGVRVPQALWATRIARRR